MSIRALAYPALLCGSLLLPGCVAGDFGESARGHFDKTVDFSPGGRFRLENTNGRVAVETWNQKKVQIEAELAASSEEELDRIHIEVRGQGDQVEVRAEMPHGEWFLWGGSRRVDYRIHLPADARLELRTVNGQVRVEGVSGELRASTVNGAVRIAEAAGSVEAKTVNGSIEADYRTLAEGRHVFSTTNGSVTLYLPSDAHGRFDAHTVNGRVSTEFPLEVNNKAGRHHLEGRLGEGGGSLDVRTVNGSVKLLKGLDKTVRRRLLNLEKSNTCASTPSNTTGRNWTSSISLRVWTRASEWKPFSMSRESTTPFRWSSTAPA